MLSMKSEVGGNGRYPDNSFGPHAIISQYKEILMTSIFVPKVHFSQYFKHTTTPNALQI